MIAYPFVMPLYTNRENYVLFLLPFATVHILIYYKPVGEISTRKDPEKT